MLLEIISSLSDCDEAFLTPQNNLLPSARAFAMLKSLTLAELAKVMSLSRPKRDEVAALAYQIYAEEGCPEGSDYLHWREAEGILWWEKVLRKVEKMKRPRKKNISRVGKGTLVRTLRTRT